MIHAHAMPTNSGSASCPSRCAFCVVIPLCTTQVKPDFDQCESARQSGAERVEAREGELLGYVFDIQ